ncbi:MAG: bifunctional phosphoribosyl-AMP cyclohydrolase/phosphoribosyl-ATP diphosphatase HisIE [Candidatus Berkiellales bacterium]
MTFAIATLDWEKMNDLIPAIVQDIETQKILMLGYMNQAALEQTLKTQRVTFYSRSRKALWEKGETSSNALILCDILTDCDQDALLILAKPVGPTCHLKTQSCFNQNVISRLEEIILQRQKDLPIDSYVAKLLNAGIARIAQKVGEEGVEVALAAALEDKQALCNEVADLLFHVLVLLRAREINFSEVLGVLTSRLMD